MEESIKNPEVLADSLSMIQKSNPLVNRDMRTYNALALAFVGDCVFELIIRTRVVAAGNKKNHLLHQETVEYVNAHAQAVLMEHIKPYLTEEEKTVFRRGRNAKPATTAKHQSHHDYRLATAMEALFGYLYLSGKTDRILELIALGEGADMAEG